MSSIQPKITISVKKKLYLIPKKKLGQQKHLQKSQRKTFKIDIIKIFKTMNIIQINKRYKIIINSKNHLARSNTLS